MTSFRFQVSGFKEAKDSERQLNTAKYSQIQFFSVVFCRLLPLLASSRRLLLSLTAFCLIFLITGCGKSPDDMYSEGKTLILKQETVDEGLKILAKFEKKYSDDPRAPEVVLAHAIALEGEKRYDEAIETFKRLMDTYPQSPEAYKGMFLLGYMYYEDMKDNTRAQEIFNSFIKAYPDSELVMSAKVLVENIGLPIEEWSTVKKIGGAGSLPDSTR